MEIDQQLEWIDDNALHKPRVYQEQLVEQALKENAIIYLPTGSGKTFIALMVLKRMSGALEGSLAEGGKRSVFLTNTVALARQQYEVIKKSTNLKVRLYVGHMNVDNWKREKWEIELDKYQVFVSTTQIILDIIRQKYISIHQFNLLIFDECHNATKGHNMLQLMGQFADTKQNDLPRVVGLTGILLKSSTKNIIEDLNNLEAVFRSKIITVANMDDFKNVLIFSTKPKEIVIPYNDSNTSFRIYNKIEELLLECTSKLPKIKVDKTHYKLTKNMGDVCLINPIRKMMNLLKDFFYQLKDLGPYGGCIAMLSVLIEVELTKRKAETLAYRQLCRVIISYAERILHLLKTLIFDQDDEDETELDVIYNSSSYKIKALLVYLKKEFLNKNMNDIKCLVFVDRRHTAKNVYHIIKKFTQMEKLPIKPNFMVGQDMLPETIECVLETKKNKNVINEFKKNECNLIVASSVLQEGIDIQSCNYVIIYDELKGFVPYVQTKGRARMDLSTYAILMPFSRESQLLGNIKVYQEIDKKLKDYLINKTIDRKPPSIEESEKLFETPIAPFYSKIGAKLDCNCAVALLSRYCYSLPNDSYTISNAQYSKIETGSDSNLLVKLVLPMQSTIKEDIISDEMPSIKLAKRSAAFKACKMLYENGELDERFLPISRKQCLENLKDSYFKEWEKYPNDDKLISGTKKNRRNYNIITPEELSKNVPSFGNVCYLYKIKIVPEFLRNAENFHIYDSLLNKSNFSILLNKTLPKIAPIPLFMTQGRLTAFISKNEVEVIIYNKEEYLKLRNFNLMIYRKLIKEIWSSNFSQDYRNADNSFLITPTTEEGKIDWELIETFQDLPDITKMIEYQRKKIILKPENFLNNLVATWYTADDSVRYIVTKIRDDLTPLSPFPNGEHESFVSFVEDKWGQRIMQKNSFMLEVEPFTSRINFFTYNEEKKKSKRFSSILLVPELVHNFGFPGHLYLKARFLPSILFRLNYILLSEKLRVSFNNFLNINTKAYDPKPLIVDLTLERLKKVEKPHDYVKTCDENIERKEIKRIENNMESFNSWKLYEEPCDLTRNIENLYKIEVDYYHYFITDLFGHMKIGDDSDQFKVMSYLESNKNEISQLTSKYAICDVSSDVKKEINILKISEKSMKIVEQCELLSSITTAGANDVFDSERYEVLGDSFLKFSVSLWLLHMHPTWNEGYLTEVKGKIVSNRNLLYQAIKLNLPGILYAKPFKPKSEWKPPSVNIPFNAENLVSEYGLSPSVFNELDLNETEINKGECEEKTLIEFQSKFSSYLNYPDNETDSSFIINKTWISDKVCADAVEALLGVCVKNYGIKKSFRFLEYFGICPKIIDFETLLDLNLQSSNLKTDITNKEVDKYLLNYEQLEKNLGYRFNDRAYLLQALTHPSYPTNRLTGCYQQLEFIGDAILDFLVTSYIFEKCAHMDPGKLTDLRSALVNNITLACISVRHKFHLFLLYQNAVLSQNIMNFVEFQEQNNFKITDQVRILAFENELKNQMADYVNVPKTLGDIFEALVGAIFLDSGNNLNKVWDVIFNLMAVEIMEFMENVPINIVRQLYEYHGAEPVFTPPFVEGDTFMVKCTFNCRNEKIEVFGFGKTAKEAKVSASKSALQHLLNA